MEITQFGRRKYTIRGCDTVRVVVALTPLMTLSSVNSND